MTPTFLSAFLCQAILPLWKCLAGNACIERVPARRSAVSVLAGLALVSSREARRNAAIRRWAGRRWIGPADFAMPCPPCDWIPASAGMTAHRGSPGRIAMRPYSSHPSGRAKGQSPSAFFPSPKTVGPTAVEQKVMRQPQLCGPVLRKR